MSGSPKKSQCSSTTQKSLTDENSTNPENGVIEALQHIICRQFQTELESRTAQIDLIQRRLVEAQKALHALRVALVTSYYNENEKATVSLLAVDEPNFQQNGTKMHPALKKLLGNKNSTDYKFDFAKGDRKAKIKVADAISESTRVKIRKVQETKAASSTVTAESENKDTLSTMINKQTNPDHSGCTIRNRNCIKYEVLVGNISQALPYTSVKGKPSHMWKVYISASKTGPDVIPLIQKVIFYLHNTYSPNDVIEIKEPPFHLQRKGWGEFPIRIEFVFKCSLNKPMNVRHNIILDRTYCGRVRIGKEQTVKFYLYEDEVNHSVNSDLEDIKCSSSSMFEIKTFDQLPEQIFESPPSKKTKMEINGETHDDDEENEDSCFLEHNYFLTGAIKQEPIDEDESNTPHLMDHSYYYTNNTSLSDLSQKTTEPIHGLEEYETITECVIEEPVLEDLKITVRRVPQIIATIKKRKPPQESLLKKIFHSKYNQKVCFDDILPGQSLLRSSNYLNTDRHQVDNKKFTVNFPAQKFESVSEALPYLFKRLPIISDQRSDVNYRSTYPYTASSTTDYAKWNVGKRLSCEWGRAKTIGRLLKKANIRGINEMTTKDIIMYGRAYGYTPLCNYNCFKNYKLPSCVFENGETHNILVESKQNSISELDVNITDISSEPQREGNKIKERYIDKKCQLACTYVKESALDVGVVLKWEEIEPGILFNAAERVLLQASLCFAEDLIRTAHSNLVADGNFNESLISAEDVKTALKTKFRYHYLVRKYMEDREYPS